MKGGAEASAPMKAPTFTGAIHKLSGLWTAFAYQQYVAFSSPQMAIGQDLGAD